MAGLVDLLLANYTTDVVGVFDDNFNPLFQGAKPIKAAINESTKVMEHPVETGITITDHKIVQPVEIQLSLILPSGSRYAGQTYRSVYQQIKQAYLKGTLLTVQTKATTYRNMIISDMPHDEDPEMYDAIALAVKLKEVLFVTATFGTLPASKVRNKANASTTPRGQQTGTAVTNDATDQSLLAKIGRAIKPGATP